MKRAVFYFGRNDYVSVNTEKLTVKRNWRGQITAVTMDGHATDFLRHINLAALQYIVHEDVSVQAKEEAKA